ncbi:hypothetical protein GCM10007920_31500 [Ciceribacter naphthalenivorans]|uniref:Uncharacterized protein n=1 Tax=Sphingomonas psychrolutea TaxID=1259676 RepID=A0ABQ6EFV3_9SPHN|nr:hypothetical protein GCM10007920_31500 [Ciceribacter naphthalenivorans]GLT06215.1 hypothetical protein GCM10007926_31500 [Sphingomonas psychrolutea]
MPSICGIVRRKPKFTPEANSIILFGPGVIEVAKAKVISAVSVAVSKAGLPKKPLHVSCGRRRPPLSICHRGNLAILASSRHSAKLA